MKKGILLVLLISLIGFISGCSNGGKPASTDGKKISIGTIQYAEHEALDSSREGFIAALEDNGFVDGENITLDIQNAQGDQSNMASICDRFVSNDMDLILAISTPAAQAIAGQTAEIPIVGTAISDYLGSRLVESYEVPGGNLTGTSGLNPIAKQMNLLVELLPEAKTVGILYTSSEISSVTQAEIAKEKLNEHGLDYVEMTVTNTNDVQQAVQSLVEKCDVIFVPTDNVIASSMPVLKGITTKSKTPVFCGEAGQVRNGGLATISINYFDLGYQTGEMAIKIINGEADPATMPIEMPNKFDFVINGAIAEEIGFTIPEKYKEYIIKE